MTSPSKIKVHLILFLISFLLGIVILEAGARVAFKNYVGNDFDGYLFLSLMNSHVFVSPDDPFYHPRYGFLPTPNSKREFDIGDMQYTANTNSSGFRGREIPSLISENKKIMLIGDSYFWGYVNNDETIAVHLEKMIQNSEVYNLSTPGYNTVQELQILRDFNSRVKPDHVVIGHFIGNDLLSNWLGEVDENGVYRDSIQKKQELIQTIHSQWTPFLDSVFFKAIFMNIIVQRTRYSLAMRSDIMGRTQKLLSDYKSSCQNSNSNCSVMVIYPKAGVQNGWTEKWIRSRRVGSQVVKIARAQGLSVLDMLDCFDGKDAARNFYHAKDGHYNSAGNQQAAACLKNHLKL